MGNYKHEKEVEAVVSGFESCTTSKDEFTHQSHLTVAVFYIHTLGEPDATQEMREGLHRFLDHHQVGRVKFNETLTVFWIKAIARFLNALEPSTTLLEKTNRVVEHFANSRFVFEYYSEDLLRSDEARNQWLEPDLKQLT